MTTQAVGTPSCTLAHQVFLYDSPDEFVGAMTPFIRSGLKRGDAIFAATKRPNIDALRAQLGDDAQRIKLEDTTGWKTRPYERLQAFKQMVHELAPGQCLSAMGEPVWEGSAAVVRQWARYESIINLALAEAPMRFICLYDSASLPDRILDYAVQTHPQRVEGQGECVPCESYVTPAEFVAGAPASPPISAMELPLEGSALRQALADYARDAGVESSRVDDLVLAANEVASNAIRHGRPPARALVWTDGDEIICQVADTGDGINDPLAGWLPPLEDEIGGWGLPIARQLCDAVELSNDGGATVSLHFARGA